jgi:hypothetical protein
MMRHRTTRELEDKAWNSWISSRYIPVFKIFFT